MEISLVTTFLMEIIFKKEIFEELFLTKCFENEGKLF